MSNKTRVAGVAGAGVFSHFDTTVYKPTFSQLCREANGRERSAAVRLRRTCMVGRIDENPPLDPAQTRAVNECLGWDSAI